MINIRLETRIRAPIERVFDLSRSIDAHLASASRTKERAVAGRTSGLIGLGETVTWSAVHLGVRQKLTVEIVAFERPHSFSDKMISGAFKSMVHHHTFKAVDNHTIMSDEFDFEAPFGVIGRIVENLLLADYMRRFLEQRNREIKTLAEGEEWQRYIRAPADQSG